MANPFLRHQARDRGKRPVSASISLQANIISYYFTGIKTAFPTLPNHVPGQKRSVLTR